MFEKSVPQTRLGSAINIVELIYHNAVRSVRKAHGNAFFSLVINIMQTATFVIMFSLMFTLLSARSIPLRGDFMLFLMTGVFMFMTHNKTIGAVMGSDGPASPMMQHAPMSTFISIAAGMLSTLYIQVLSMVVILFIYDVGFNPRVISEIRDPIGCLAMLLLSWISGAAIGLLFLSIKPWAPSLVGILSNFYRRANMIASGKMFVANSLPGYMIAMFDWNPLFHTIDQARGYTFVNYYPRNSNWEYVLYFSIILLMIGMMGEFYTRKHASASWSART